MALHGCLGYGDLAGALTLLKNMGPAVAKHELSLRDPLGHTPIYFAVEADDCTLLEAMLDKGADVNVADKNFLQPMHWAALRGSLKCIPVLAKYAKVTCRVPDGVFVDHTPITLCHLTGNLLAITSLLCYCSDDPDRWTAVDLLIFNSFTPDFAPEDLRQKVQDALAGCDSEVAAIVSLSSLSCGTPATATCSQYSLKDVFTEIQPALPNCLHRWQKCMDAGLELNGIRVLGVNACKPLYLDGGPQNQGNKFPITETVVGKSVRYCVFSHGTDNADPVFALFPSENIGGFRRRQSTMICKSIRVATKVKRGDITVSHVGYLNKQSGKRHVWKRRWAVLSGNFLFFFSSHRDEEPIGWLNVESCQVEPRNTDFGAAFSVHIDNVSFKFLCADIESMEAWVAQIQQARYEVVSAAERKDWNTVKAMAETGRNVNMKARNGRTVLHYLANAGEHTVLAELMIHGAADAINTTDNFGMSPLHYACINEKPESADFVRHLLVFGADPTLRVATKAGNRAGKLPLELAKDAGNDAIAEILLGNLPDSESAVVANQFALSEGAENELYGAKGANIVFSSTNANVSLDDFELISVIGKGTFGKVFKAKHKSTGKSYAVKTMQKQKLLDMKQVEHIMAEKSIMSRTRHPFIVGLNFAFQKETKLYMVLDYAPGGDLYFRLNRETKGKFSESVARFVASEIFLALKHCHSNDVAHRDLKAENVLIDDEGHVKLTDFGLSKMGMDDPTFSFVGTPEYIAPEILLNSGHGLAVDWWSFGVLTYEMLVGQPPFTSQSAKVTYDRILNDEAYYPSHISKDAKNLLKGLLRRDPKQRFGCGPLGAMEIQQHPWFKSVNWNKLEARKVKSPFRPRGRKEDDLHNFDPVMTVLEPATDSIAVVKDGTPAEDLSRFDDFDWCPGAAPQ